MKNLKLFLASLLLCSPSAFSYELHFEREKPITIEEWSSTINNFKAVRINDSPIKNKNPNTGEIITIIVPTGSAQVFFPKKNSWHHVFNFGKEISFSPNENWDNPNNELRLLTFDIANELGAKIVGQEGEVYNQPTKKPWWKFW